MESPFLELDHIELPADDRETTATELTGFFGGNFHPTTSGNAMMVVSPGLTFELKSGNSVLPRLALRVKGNEHTKYYLKKRGVEMDFSNMKKGGGPIFFDLVTNAGILHCHSVVKTDGIVVALTLPSDLHDIEGVDAKSVMVEEHLEALATQTAIACVWIGNIGLVIRNPTVDDTSPYGLSVQMAGDTRSDKAEAVRRYCVNPLRLIGSLYGINPEDIKISVTTAEAKSHAPDLVAMERIRKQNASDPDAEHLTLTEARRTQ